jgi:hypothetical protein
MQLPRRDEEKTARPHFVLLIIHHVMGSAFPHQKQFIKTVLVRGFDIWRQGRVRFQRVDVKVDTRLLVGGDEVFYFVNREWHNVSIPNTGKSTVID